MDFVCVILVASELIYEVVIVEFTHLCYSE